MQLQSPFQKFASPSEGAAEGGFKGEFHRARAFRRSEAEAVSFFQKRFAHFQTKGILSLPKSHFSANLKA
jgi:hypothetical protein